MSIEKMKKGSWIDDNMMNKIAWFFIRMIATTIINKYNLLKTDI